MATAPAAPLHTIATPLSDSDVVAQKAHLADLQGNILKHHGRRHAAHVFIKFKAGKTAAAKKWVGKDLKERLTTAQKQLDAAAAFRATGKDGGPFWAFTLTASGCTFLGFDVMKLDKTFRNGMSASSSKLNDPPVSSWETWAQGQIDAMMLVADREQANVRFLAMALEAEISKFADVVHVQFGDQRFNERDNGIEHFGYVDGRSQPLMLESDFDGESDGMTNFDPKAGPSLVLVSDPFGAPGASGSYFVFRKLEEKVRAFKIHEQELATALGLTGDARELAGAMVIGRFEDGTPVTLSNEPMIESTPKPNGQSVPNNFDYSADKQGAKCPFHGHIRKSNPRGSGPGGLQDEMSRRMARRGITYGQRRDDGSDISSMPEGDVGLLFMAYQADIARQFEFIQQSSVNDPAFPQNLGGTGIDPVIGQHKAGTPAGAQSWPKVWGKASAGQVAFSFADFVVMKGGTYMFAPALSSL